MALKRSFLVKKECEQIIYLKPALMSKTFWKNLSMKDSIWVENLVWNSNFYFELWAP